MEQPDNKSVDINISNKAIDATVDGIKGFLQSLIKPSIDEVGLLLADQVKAFRFKNQLKTLTKTQEYLKGKNINSNKISLKVLVPLLEYSSLEEEESMQEKWAALLANTALNKQYHNSLFSHILSQLSPLEAKILDDIYTLSNQNTLDPNIKVWIKGNVSFTVSELYKMFGDISLEIDNLVRLRLILITHTLNPGEEDFTDITLSDLGFLFCTAVKFN